MCTPLAVETACMLPGQQDRVRFEVLPDLIFRTAAAFWQ